MISQETLRKYIKTMRDSSGLSMETISRITGVSRTTISELLSGKQKGINFSTLQLIVDACGYEICFVPKEMDGRESMP